MHTIHVRQIVCRTLNKSLHFPGLLPLVAAFATAWFWSSAAAEEDGDPLVDLARTVPGIVIDLRYATPDNVAGEALYPPRMRCYVRRTVARRLRVAQHFVSAYGYRLKIWDAYRPPAAQARLWHAAGRGQWAASPDDQGSLHSWGIAVDATLVDSRGHEVPMPTDFDEFGEGAAMVYAGDDPTVAWNLYLLQSAMKHAGFMGMKHEWWHFLVSNWRDYGPIMNPPDDTQR